MTLARLVEHRVHRLLDLGQRTRPESVRRQRQREQHQPLDRRRTALRHRHASAVRPSSSQTASGTAALGRSTHSSMITLRVGSSDVLDLPGQELDDVAGGRAVEERQDAVDRVELARRRARGARAGCGPSGRAAG